MRFHPCIFLCLIWFCNLADGKRKSFIETGCYDRWENSRTCNYVASQSWFRKARLCEEEYIYARYCRLTCRKCDGRITAPGNCRDKFGSNFYTCRIIRRQPVPDQIRMCKERRYYQDCLRTCKMCDDDNSLIKIVSKRPSTSPKPNCFDYWSLPTCEQLATPNKQGKSLCNDKRFYSHCRRTCKKCCKDLHSNCAQYKQICKYDEDFRWSDWVRRNCKETCKLCGNGCTDEWDKQSCEFIASEEPNKKSLCNDKSWYPNCRKTCKICVVTTPEPTTVSTSKPTAEPTHEPTSKTTPEATLEPNSEWTSEPTAEKGTADCRDDWSQGTCKSVATPNEFGISFCDDKRFYSYCRKTCKKCKGGCKDEWDKKSCEFIASEGPNKVTLCNDTKWYPHCRKTCNKCKQ